MGLPEPGSGEPIRRLLGRRAAGGDLGRVGGGDNEATGEGERRNPLVTDGWEQYATTIKEPYRDAEPSRVTPNWKILKPTEGSP